MSYVSMQETMTVVEPDTWEIRDLYTLYGVPRGAVAHIVLVNKSTSYEAYIGVRRNGSGINEQFALTRGRDGNQLLSVFVQTDVDGKIEIRKSWITPVEWRLIGYLTGCTFTTLAPAREELEPANFGVWEDYNVLTEWGVPANRVLAVTIENYDDPGHRWGGIRENGSTLERRFKVIRQISLGAGCVGGALVQVDASGIVEVYAEVDYEPRIRLQGYFSSNVSFTEGHTTTDMMTSGVWTDEDLTDEGVPDNGIASIILLNEYDDAGMYAGVRPNGSGLNRREDIRESYAGAQVGYMVLVEAGPSAIVEIFEQSQGVVVSMYHGHLTVPEPVISMIGGPLEWDWGTVQAGVSVVPITTDGGRTWGWGTATGTIMIPVGGPLDWDWEEHTF